MSAEFLASLFSLHGKTAIVSGASRGIGFAIAEGLHKAGATVIGIGRSAAPAQSYAPGMAYRQCDVTDTDGFSRVCADVAGRHGSVDIYVHAAGISLTSRTEAEAIENFDKTLDVNLRAAYRCALAVTRTMRDSGGSIINVTSIGSKLGFPGNPGYVASKGGLRMLTKALALDLGSRNIRVNNLAPGYVHTAMTDKSFNDPALHQERLQHTMLKRWGKPGDVVGAAIFLASEASAYVTGQDIFVDGGWMAKGL